MNEEVSGYRSFKKKRTLLIDDTISERYAYDQTSPNVFDELYIEFCKRIEN